MERKELVVIAIATFLVVVIWVGTSVLGTKSSVEEKPNLQQLLEPIDPSLDQDTLDKVSQITPFDKSEARPTPTPRPTRTPRPTPTPRTVTDTESTSGAIPTSSPSPAATPISGGGITP